MTCVLSMCINMNIFWLHIPKLGDRIHKVQHSQSWYTLEFAVHQWRNLSQSLLKWIHLMRSSNIDRRGFMTVYPDLLWFLEGYHLDYLTCWSQLKIQEQFKQLRYRAKLLPVCNHRLSVLNRWSNTCPKSLITNRFVWIRSWT